jgi:hypothetical protein
MWLLVRALLIFLVRLPPFKILLVVNLMLVCLKWMPDLANMIWSTTFGGSDDDAAYSVVIDASENLFLAGGTRSTNFPATVGALQTANAGGETDGFITHIDKNGQINIASTYYGYADYDQIYFVDLDKQSNVYVFGQADQSGSQYIKNALL